MAENRKMKNKKPVFKQWWFWVLALLVIVGLSQSCGKKNEKTDTAEKLAVTAAPTAEPTKTPTAEPTPTVEPLPEREEMDGFDKETNLSVEYGGVIFQIPSYMTKTETDDPGTETLRYAYNDGQNEYALKFEMADTTGEKFLSSRDEVQANIIKNSVNGKLRESKDQNIEGMMSRIFEMTCGENSDVLGRVLMFYNYDTSKAICVTAVEKLTAPKTFSSDTTKIFYTIKKIVPEKEPAESTAAAESEPAVTTPVPAESTAEEPSGGVSPEFKKTMDEYEAFFNEYAEFMKKYNNSDDAMSMLNDYLSMLTRYSEAIDGLDKIDTEALSAADYAYYTEVMLRIDAKLLEAAAAMQ